MDLKADIERWIEDVKELGSIEASHGEQLPERGRLVARLLRHCDDLNEISSTLASALDVMDEYGLSSHEVTDG